jgi:hypothetical protein
MQKPGASPQVNASYGDSAEGAKYSVEEFLFHFTLVGMATPYLAPSALPIRPDVSWGDAPGFYISRPWRLVDRFIRGIRLFD